MGRRKTSDLQALRRQFGAMALAGLPSVATAGVAGRPDTAQLLAAVCVGALIVLIAVAVAQRRRNPAATSATPVLTPTSPAPDASASQMIELQAALDRLSRYLQNMDEVIVSCPLEERGAWAKALKGSGVHGEVTSELLREIGVLGVIRRDDADVSTLLVSTGPLGIRARITKRVFDLRIGTPDARLPRYLVQKVAHSVGCRAVVGANLGGIRHCRRCMGFDP